MTGKQELAEVWLELGCMAVSDCDPWWGLTWQKKESGCSQGHVASSFAEIFEYIPLCWRFLVLPQRSQVMGQQREVDGGGYFPLSSMSSIILLVMPCDSLAPALGVYEGFLVVP